MKVDLKVLLGAHAETMHHRFDSGQRWTAGKAMTTTTEQTKYQRISELAGAYAEAFMAHRTQCRVEAHALLAAAEAYFQAPTAAFQLLSLDSRLERRCDQPRNLELVQGRDAFWYFGFAMKFEGSQLGFSEAMFTLGLKSSPEAVVARLTQDIRLDAAAPEGWTPVLRIIEADLLEHYRRPAFVERRPLGFIAA